MYLILLCVTGWILASSSAAEKAVYDLDNMEQLFEFIITHKKSYPNNEEKQKRFDIFKENVKLINHKNSVSEAIFGITRVSDLTTEEFVRMYTGLPKNTNLTRPVTTCKVITDGDLSTNEAPESFDWREKNVVTPIKNQDPCGSCWSFSCSGNIEGQYAIKNKNLISLSEQQLMDCLQASGHCDMGAFMVDIISELKTTPGLESELDYPYSGKKEDQACALDKTKSKAKVVDCYQYKLTDENKLKEAVFKHGPVAIGLEAMSWGPYKGGILTAKDCPVGLDHAVLLVGYGTENGKDYWIVKNSWGEPFGEKGYIRLSRGENTCGLLNDEAASAIVE